MAIEDMFLHLDGVIGESHDARHKDFIDLVSWSWGMQSPTDQSTGHATGKARVNALRIVKRADRSSPVLIGFLNQNTVVKKGRLIVRKAGGTDPLTYYEVHLEQVRVTNFETQTQGQEVVETVALAFERATFEYTPQAGTGAKGGGTVSATVSAYKES